MSENATIAILGSIVVLAIGLVYKVVPKSIGGGITRRKRGSRRSRRVKI
jgi:hypothetical protein